MRAQDFSSSTVSSARRRLIDRLNQSDGPAAFPAIDERRAILANRQHEIGELPRVADMRNGRRIARSAGGAHLLREALLDRLILRRRRIELPADEIVLLDDDEPRSPCTAIVFGNPGQTLVVAWMTPSAPLAKRRHATAVSSTSIRSCASMVL